MSIQCYSRRIMSPFQGTLQAIRAGVAEAECRDGINWIIYLTSESILSHTGMNETRYGTWSSSGGLCRERVIGSPLAQDHRDMVDEIVSALERLSHTIPFPPIDQYEQWLLARHDRTPIALLNTAIHTKEFNPRQTPCDWRPSQSVCKYFQCDAGEIEDLVATMKSHGGGPPKAMWFRRDNERVFDLSGNELVDVVFPDTPVQANHFQGEHRTLVNTYIEFDAPAILQLTTLPESSRAAMEQAAWRHPRRVAELYRQYPYIIDKEGLKVTLVKASIMGME